MRNITLISTSPLPQIELGPEQLKWVAALESNEYAQCKDRLKTTTGHCCLGVSEEVNGAGFELIGGSYYTKSNGSRFNLSEETRLITRLRDDLGRSLPGFFLNFDGRTITQDVCLSTLNDDYGFTFEEIAFLLKTYPGAFFEASA